MVKKAKKKPSIPRRDFGIRARGDRVTVPTADVFPNPWNPNEQASDMQQKTRRSLERFGNVAEVLVREVGPAKAERRGQRDKVGYEIIDGEHRWRECVAMGVPDLEVRNLGEVSDYEAMQITAVIDELSGAPEPLKLADLVATLDAGGYRSEMEEVFPFSKDELDGLVRLRTADQEFIDTASSRLKRKVRDAGVQFKIGARKAKLPEGLGKRLIIAYEALGARCHTNDVVAVAAQIAAVVEEALRKGEEDSGGEDQDQEGQGQDQPADHG